MRRNMILAVWFIIFASAFGNACGKSTGASPIRNKLLEMTVLPSVRTSNGASPYVEWKNGPPIPPKRIIDDYRKIRIADTTGAQIQFDDVLLFYSEHKKIDFKDFAELVVWWLDEQLWP